MRNPGNPTLEQLRVLIAVIDSGSFSRAAKQLHRTQSVISYTIANLEAQLNITLFDRSKRRPELTEAGKLLLADARTVALKVDAMRARAKSLSEGLEPEVALAVDVMFPACALVGILESFQRQFPSVGLRLRIEGLGGVLQLVLDQTCTIGISGWMTAMPDHIERQQIGHVHLIPVAAPSHALAQYSGLIPTTLLREQTQLVLTDRTSLTAGRDFGVHALRDWRLGDLGAKHALLRAGLGWGNLPEALVRDDLANGHLVRLLLAEQAETHYPLYLIQRTDSPPGAAGRWLMQRFAEHQPDLPFE